MSTIGSDSLSGITIDGEIVQEITIGGDVVWTRRKIVDSWEDGNHGDDWPVGYNLSVSNTYPVYRGSYSVKHVFNASIKTYSNPGDGLEHYPKQGETTEALIYITDLQTGQYIYWVGVENTSNDGHSYGLGDEIRANGNNSDFYFRFSDRSRNMLEETPISDPRNKWLRMRIHWAEDDNHTAWLLDIDGNVIEQLTGTSTQYRTDNSICLHGNNYGSGGRTGTAYWDSIQVV